MLRRKTTVSAEPSTVPVSTSNSPKLGLLRRGTTIGMKARKPVEKKKSAVFDSAELSYEEVPLNRAQIIMSQLLLYKE